MTRARLLAATLAFPLAVAVADNEVLLQSGSSWNGAPVAYPEGEARITVVRVALDEGQQTPFHCHPVPTVGYLLKGALEVETGAGETVTLRAGSAAIEVMDALHRGTALDGGAELLVVYAGAAGIENTLGAEHAGCPGG